MIKELFYENEEDVTIYTNGIVLKAYDEVRNGYNFKIIADVAVVDDGCIHVYGASDDNGDDSVLWTNVNEFVNELVGFTDTAITINVVGEDFRLPEKAMVISDCMNDNSFDTWALMFYYPYPESTVLYVKYNDFDESSYKELTSILSKLYFF